MQASLSKFVQHRSTHIMGSWWWCCRPATPPPGAHNVSRPMLNELRQRSLHEWPANPATVAAASATSTTELSPSSGGSHFQGTLFWTFGGQDVSDNLFG